MTLRYMLDTNIVSHIMQGRDSALLARLSQVAIGQTVNATLVSRDKAFGQIAEGLKLEIW